MDEERKQSTHKVEVVPLILEKHPNADRLSIAKVFGFTCVTATEQWAGHDRAAYIPPDSLVSVARDEFSFLAKDANAEGKVRIRAKKLRGALSFGLLVPAPAGARLGDDVADIMGVEHYEPPLPGTNRGGIRMGGEVAAAPQVSVVKYDLESGRRYAEKALIAGEQVIVTEKIHGANARYVFSGGEMHCGSRTEWKKEYPTYDHLTVEFLAAQGMEATKAEEVITNIRAKKVAKNLWWQALDATPALRLFCEANPDVVVYGEVYGAVQDLNYGHQKGQVSFAAFDLFRDGQWVNPVDAMVMATAFKLPWVPVIGTMAYDFDEICKLAEGKSLIAGANHVREGIVVSPLQERWDHYVGRHKLKFVGAGYLEKATTCSSEESA